MSGSIRLLVCDVDGTLVRHDKSLSHAVVAAIRRVRDAGMRVSLISARPPSGMFAIARSLDLIEAMGAFNGGTLFQPDGSILLARQLEPASAKSALDLLDHPEVTPWLFRSGHWYAQLVDAIHVPRERLSACVEPVIKSDFSGLLCHVDKIVGVSDNHALLARLDEQLTAILGSTATVGRSQLYYLDVTAPGANKGDGLTALAAAAGVRLDEVAVIGDQRNDLAMFAHAGFSIAMGQSPPAVRAAADVVTRSNDEDGVAHAVDAFILPRIAR